MIFILHGDNQAQSRLALTNLLEKCKATANQAEVSILSGKTLTRSVLETALQPTSLFGNDRIVVIEELHANPPSKKRTELSELIVSAAMGQTIILWEKKLLTKAALKPFPEAKVEVFKVSPSLFNWLDGLVAKPTPPQRSKLLQLLAEAIKQEGDWLTFTLLAGRIRNLITALDGGQLTGAPFMIAKLKKQASSFSLAQLLKLHHQLSDIDYAHKTGKNKLTLTQELDQITIKL